ncbi:MAG: hypothetical protein KTR20_01890 [Cellvibrionaceae bacterium]|nr:hypothetical protein [Cellvibrionaceae bacterium]
MSHYIYYPQQRCTLDDIAATIKTPVLSSENSTQILQDSNRHINPDKFMQSHQPVIIPTQSQSQIRSPILSPAEHRILKSMNHDISGVATATTAELFGELQRIEIPSAVGDTNTFGTAAQSSKFMIDDVITYDKHLKTYHDYVKIMVSSLALMLTAIFVDQLCIWFGFWS